MITTLSTTETFKNLEHKMQTCDRLYYTRFGDGDLNIMNGTVNNKRRCITSDYHPELEKELREAFFIEDDCYMKALGANYPVEEHMKIGLFAPHRENNEIIGWINNNLGITDATYESHILFHYLACFHPERYKYFMKRYIKNERKMFVGYLPINKMERMFGQITYHVEVPKKNSYFNINEWYPRILENINDVDIIIMNAGRSSAVVHKRLYELKDIKVKSLDVGSITEGAAGVASRTWVKLAGKQGINFLGNVTI